MLITLLLILLVLSLTIFSKSAEAESAPVTEPSTDPPATPPPEEKTITEAELQRLLSEMQTNTTQEVTSRLEAEYVDRLKPETIGDLPFDEAIALLETMDTGDDDGDDDESEEVKSLRQQYETEISDRDATITQNETDKADMRSKLELQLIDNALVSALVTRGANTPAIIAEHLKRYVQLDTNDQPQVVNEKGEQRIVTETLDKDGTRRVASRNMEVKDLIEEFLSQEENAHFIPASQREGSGGRGGAPLDADATKDANYNAALAEARKTGKINSPAYRKARREKFAESLSA